MEEGKQDKIEVNGQTYISYDKEKELKYQKTKDILLLILIGVAVIALVMAIVTLINNRDIINKDALIIGMNTHGFESCQCTDESGIKWFSTETGFVTQPTPPHSPTIQNIFEDIE